MENNIEFDEVAFMMGYMNKQAEPNDPYAAQEGVAPQQLAAQRFGENQGVVGKGTDYMANMDPSKRAMGTHLGVGALGALGGYMAGGDATSALLGGGLAALVSFLAHTFFGKDINKGWQKVNQMANQGTLDSMTKQINEQYNTQFESKVIQGEFDLKKLDINIQKEMAKPADQQNPELLAEMNKKKATLWKQTGRTPNLDMSLDKNEDGILDSEQTIGAQRAVSRNDADPDHQREVDPGGEYFPAGEGAPAGPAATTPPATTPPVETTGAPPANDGIHVGEINQGGVDTLTQNGQARLAASKTPVPNPEPTPDFNFDTTKLDPNATSERPTFAGK